MAIDCIAELNKAPSKDNSNFLALNILKELRGCQDISITVLIAFFL